MIGPFFQQLLRLYQADAILLPLDPFPVLQESLDIRCLPETHAGRFAQLLDSPRPFGFRKKHPQDPGGFRVIQGPDDSLFGERVGIALTADEDPVKGKEAIACKIDVADTLFAAYLRGCGRNIGRDKDAVRSRVYIPVSQKLADRTPGKSRLAVVFHLGDEDLLPLGRGQAKHPVWSVFRFTLFAANFRNLHKGDFLQASRQGFFRHHINTLLF